MALVSTGDQKFKLQDTFQFRFILFASCIVFIILREPALLLSPRLWAEEGTIFYAFALHHSVWDIFTTAHVGYLTLFNSIVSALQAKVFSVESAAIVSTYLGFLIQLVPVYIITCTTYKLWDSPLKKIICNCIVIVVMAPELWLNTTDSHFIFGLITFLILVIPATTLAVFQKYLFSVLLFIGGLTGPASIFFTPTFLVQAWREKSKEKYIQAGILSFCALIQTAVILYAIFYNNTYHRLSTPHLKTTAYHFIIDNFSLLPHSASFNYQLFSFDLISLSGILMAIFYAYLLIKHRKKTDFLIALLSFMVVAVFSTLGSLDMAGGARYAYIPTCILLIILTSEVVALKNSKKNIRYLTSLILIVCLSLNIIWYIPTMMDWAYKPSYPEWSAEAAKWRADTSYTPKIHPAFNNQGWPVKM